MRVFLFSFFALVCLPFRGGAQPFGNPDFLAPDIPSPQPVVDRMLAAAHLRPGETLYDLGCGSGRIVITAAQKFKARAVGVELSNDIYKATLQRVRRLGLEDRVRIINANALHVDLTPADVVTLYLLTGSNEKLKPSLERLKPGARVISHEFQIRGWKPSDIEQVEVDGIPHMIYVYEMPPKRVEPRP